MTATAADALRMLAPDTPQQWPAGILAAALSREAMAKRLPNYVEWGSVRAWHLAAVRHWRGTVERHRPIDGWQKPESACFGCRFNGPWTSCPELTEVADEARAYLGGSP